MTIDSAISLKGLKQINKKVIGNWTYYYLLLLLKLTSFSQCYSIKGPQEYKIGWRTPSIIIVWCFGLQHIIIKEKTQVFSLFVRKGSHLCFILKAQVQSKGKMENKIANIVLYIAITPSSKTCYGHLCLLNFCLLQSQRIWFAPKRPPSALLVNEQKECDM